MNVGKMRMEMKIWTKMKVKDLGKGGIHGVEQHHNSVQYKEASNHRVIGLSNADPHTLPFYHT